jgi:hypothetical protein
MRSADGKHHRTWTSATLALSTVIFVGWPGQAIIAKSIPDETAETHCVVRVLGERPSGEFIVTEPTCFSTFAAAMASASDGALSLPSRTAGDIPFRDARVASTLASFTLGIHYDGFGGTGSSISVVGSSCTGGWWNTPSSWRNRISSSYNGCTRLRHYDNPNTSGSYQDTYGAGTTDNLSSLNNRAESVSYHSS